MREELGGKRMFGISPSLFKCIYRLSSYSFAVYRDVSTGAGRYETFISPGFSKPLDAP